MRRLPAASTGLLADSSTRGTQLPSLLCSILSAIVLSIVLCDGTSLERPVTCEHCGKPRAECKCPRDGNGNVKLPKDQAARVRREKRRGKFVTVVVGLDPAATDIDALLKQLRKQLATGGSVREDGIELQGDHRDRIVEMLKAMGYPDKPSGG